MQSTVWRTSPTDAPVSFHGLYVGGSWLRMKLANVSRKRMLNQFNTSSQQRAKNEINALKLLSLENFSKRLSLPSFRPSDTHINKEAHMQNEGKPSFRRRHKMFKTVPSLQARPHVQRRNPGIRTPPLSFLAL